MSFVVKDQEKTAKVTSIPQIKRDGLRLKTRKLGANGVLSYEFCS